MSRDVRRCHRHCSVDIWEMYAATAWLLCIHVVLERFGDLCVVVLYLITTTWTCVYMTGMGMGMETLGEHMCYLQLPESQQN